MPVAAATSSSSSGHHQNHLSSDLKDQKPDAINNRMERASIAAVSIMDAQREILDQLSNQQLRRQRELQRETERETANNGPHRNLSQLLTQRHHYRMPYLKSGGGVGSSNSGVSSNLGSVGTRNSNNNRWRLSL